MKISLTRPMSRPAPFVAVFEDELLGKGKEVFVDDVAFGWSWVGKMAIDSEGRCWSLITNRRTQEIGWLLRGPASAISGEYVSPKRFIPQQE